jgi:hypothetical protein
MNAANPSRGRPWALYSTYLRLIVCFLLLPLLVTGFVVSDARSDFVAIILICLCCLYIDRDTVMRRRRATPKSALESDERDASS